MPRGEFVSPATGARFGIRPVAPEDGPEVVALFNRVFRRSGFPPFSLDEWVWKYHRSPAAMPRLCFLAQDEGGGVVGHIGSMPARLNILGVEERTVTQWLDGMIEPAAQRTGILIGIFADYLEAQIEAGVAAAIAMPNEKSIVSHTPRSTMMFFLEKYHLPLAGEAHERLRRRVEAAHTPVGIELDLDHRIDGSGDALWHSVRGHELLSLVKDAQHLRWKYVDNPRTSYRIVALRDRAGAPVALAVCAEGGDRALLLELLSFAKDVSLSQRLLLGLGDHLHARGIRELRFVGRDPWYFDAVFEDFERRPSSFYPFFVDATREDERRTFETPLSWTVTLGDNDEV